MTVPAFNTVTWFQVGTDAPAEARRFYGDLFGYPGADTPSGGIAYGSDASGNHAMFLVLVEDVDAACARAEAHGGKIAMPAVTTPPGLKFAYLEDPTGNRFGVFTPPAS